MTYALECFTLSPNDYQKYPSFSDPERNFLSNKLTDERQKLHNVEKLIEIYMEKK